MAESKIHLVLSELMDGMSESALAKAVSLPKATINRVLSGKTPDPRAGTLVPIAQYFNITVDQLLGIAPLPQNTPLGITKESHIEIPYVDYENLCDYINNAHSPQKKVELSLLSNKRLTINCFVTKLISDELSPQFATGALLIISKNIPKLKSNDIILAYSKTTNKVIFRKLMIANGMNFLSSPNPNYDIMPLTDDFVVFGIIIEGRILA